MILNKYFVCGVKIAFKYTLKFCAKMCRNNNNNNNFIVPIKGPSKRQRVTYKTNIDSMYI
jgi:hypothetical protein